MIEKIASNFCRRYVQHARVVEDGYVLVFRIVRCFLGFRQTMGG